MMITTPTIAAISTLPLRKVNNQVLLSDANPNPVQTWMEGEDIASYLAHDLDYIHNNTGLNICTLVHNHIKSSSIIVTEPSFNAKLCHFGTAQLCGKIDEDENNNNKDKSKKSKEISEIQEVLEEEEEESLKTLPSPKLKRSNSQKMQFQALSIEYLGRNLWLKVSMDSGASSSRFTGSGKEERREVLLLMRLGQGRVQWCSTGAAEVQRNHYQVFCLKALEKQSDSFSILVQPDFGFEQ
ncbi:hypothetical protein CMV_030457 [Castanea mollissima]|uniref:Protein kinase domain-containing protein n=1 Tax=Castanea mollissima TaxID=60419 RepID=A0A8J4Q6N5_9ROSI|nr:hypothetical protein CMV_030457 [Castanea mollissima]